MQPSPPQSGSEAVRDSNARSLVNAVAVNGQLPTPEDAAKPDKVFRLRKQYQDNRPPQNDPDKHLSASDCYDSKNHTKDAGAPNTQPAYAEAPNIQQQANSQSPSALKNAKKPPNPYAPFPNRSSFELGEWFHGQGNLKSQKDFQGLVKILANPSFSLDDIRDTKWSTVFQDLGKNKDEILAEKSEWVDDSGWKVTPFEIEVPIHDKMAKGKGVESHIAGVLHHRSIVSILEEKVMNAPTSRFFHLDAHELRWQPGGKETSPEFRVISELYNSDAFLEAQSEIRNNPPPSIKDCPHPRVVVGAMFWSDATHLSTFSTSKLWPLYMLFGNDSKYQRGSDTSESCYHVAYFDSVSGSLFPWSQFILIRPPDIR